MKKVICDYCGGDIPAGMESGALRAFDVEKDGVVLSIKVRAEEGKDICQPCVVAVASGGSPGKPVAAAKGRRACAGNVPGRPKGALKEFVDNIVGGFKPEEEFTTEMVIRLIRAKYPSYNLNRSSVGPALSKLRKAGVIRLTTEEGVRPASYELAG